MQIVHAHDRGRVGQQVFLGKEILDLLGDHRRTPLPAADIDGKADLAGLVLLQMQADVMHLDRGAVAVGAGDGDLEFSGQEGEFRVDGRPLAQDFGIRPRIGDLVGRSTGEMVGGDVADAIARRLQRVHLDARKLGQDIRRVGQFRPVVLDVLAGGEMPVAAVVFAGDMGEHPHLLGIQRPIGDRDAQHVGVQLKVDAVHQAQRLEGILGQFTGEAAADLIAELLHAARNKSVVEFVVTVHDFLKLR